MKALAYILFAGLFLFGCTPKKESQTKEIEVNVIIKTQPRGVSVFIDDKLDPIGKTPIQYTLQDDKSHMLRFEHPDYETTWRKIPASSESGSVRLDEIKMTPFSVPLVLKSKPSGATVSLNDEDLGKTPIYLKSVPLGRHKATFKVTGFDEKRMDINLDTPEYKIITAKMDSVMGNVVAVTDPPGADVYLDGIDKGTSDETTGRLDLGEVMEGKHLLTVKKDTFTEMEQDFLLKRGESKVISVPKLHPKPGVVKVVTTPAGANVYRDGLLVGITPTEIKNLDPGQITIRVESEGFAPVQKVVNVLPGITKLVNINLSSNFGGLTLSTEPSGCAVIIDGAKKGETEPGAVPGISKPFEIEQIRPGVHTLVIDKAGYETLKKQILIEKGKKTPLKTIKLKKLWLPTHRLKVKGTMKVVLVRVQQEDDKQIEVEERKDNGAKIRYVVKRENIEILKKLE